MAGFRGYGGLSRRDMFALEAMKVLLPLYADNLALLAERSVTVADLIVSRLDVPVSGEDGPSIVSEFDDSAQGVADSVVGRGEVLVDASDDSGVDYAALSKEFFG